METATLVYSHPLDLVSVSSLFSDLPLASSSPAMLAFDGGPGSHAQLRGVDEAQVAPDADESKEIRLAVATPHYVFLDYSDARLARSIVERLVSRGQGPLLLQVDGMFAAPDKAIPEFARLVRQVD